ncbi:cation diffusion facilitator family transporter [Janibacter sp. HTCC2649]|uniref:cation diffusion facilitator family transporter n=1 Tax=Janibacter sp. HTCC2649 TaxID=313589 RepID=UPI0003219569|nr:cation transporter [Janibacter sp. HTCC2649]
MTTWTTLATPARRTTLMRRAQLLAGASVAYNTVEAVIAITAGNIAGSSALVGFGLDSLVEVSSGLVILWQFRHPMPESRERTSQRLIAISFFALAAYLTVEAGHALLTGAQPDSSPIGIGLAIASLAVMPFLSVWQRRTGRELGSGAVEGDGTQTLLCTYLSAVLLIGLVLNASLGWTWADPVAALIIAAVAAREGWENWQGDDCCTPAALSAVREGSAGATGCADDACCASAPSEGGERTKAEREPAPVTLSRGEDRQ